MMSRQNERESFVSVRLIAVTLALWVTLSGPARAQESEFPLPGTLTGSVYLASDYVFRGISFTDEEPTIQANFYYTHPSGFYVGLWGTNTDFGPSSGFGEHLEFDPTAGYAGVGPFGINYDFNYFYYHYAGVDHKFDLDMHEFGLFLNRDFGAFNLATQFIYSPEFSGDAGPSEYYALDLGVPVPYPYADRLPLSLKFHIGTQQRDDDDPFATDDYSDWSVGANIPLKAFDLSVTYSDTDLDDWDSAGEQVVFMLSRSFGATKKAGLHTEEGAPPLDFPGEITGEIGFTTDHVFRGFTLSDEEAAVIGSLKYPHPSGFYAGLWMSDIHLDGASTADEHVKMRFWSGFTGETDLGLKWNADYYFVQFPGVATENEFDFHEFGGGLAYDFEHFSLWGGAYYSPDYFLGSGGATWFGVEGGRAIPHPFSDTVPA
ncbi:MAG: hypothetical protein HOK82_12220, partial [Rhodospirillaceae bacterium]|nr:hypothetical protein [Rhodospirillaceae bacterium]